MTCNKGRLHVMHLNPYRQPMTPFRHDLDPLSDKKLQRVPHFITVHTLENKVTVLAMVTLKNVKVKTGIHEVVSLILIISSVFCKLETWESSGKLNNGVS